MEGGGAYGAGKATGQFDYLAYIKKPQVILRAVSWVGRPILTVAWVFFSPSGLLFHENALMSLAFTTRL